MPINVLATAGISLDAAGLYRQTLSAPDGVFIFTDGLVNWEIINKQGPYVARLGGILPSAGDVTSALQTIINSSDVTEVVFDEGNITINGTLTVPAGKTLTFQNDGKLVGTGTVNGGIINANFQKAIFAQTLTVNPEGVSNKYFSAKWFGATGNGSTDDHGAIQTSLYTVIRNRSKVKSVFLPEGNYRITAPLIMHNWGGGRYNFFNCDLIGESSFWEESSAGTKITAAFSDGNTQFAIGVQAGKGVRIRNLKIVGNYAYNFTTSATFYASDYASYLPTTPCRDTRYSPYSGIVIDPFTNSVASAPVGDTYPGTDGFVGTLPDGTKQLAAVNLSDYYRGTGGDFGSTGVTIDDSFIVGFTVGLITSPNGSTLNAELLDVSRIQFENCKACIAGCQAQEKVNRVSFLGCWGNCHTVLMYNQYGKSGENNGQTGHWIIENVNLAGYNNRLINRSESGWFPMSISKVYAESLGRIGDLSLTMGTTISDSTFDFAYITSETKQYFLSLASGVAVFKNCQFRWYGGEVNGYGQPIPMDGRFTFTECKISMPMLLPDQYNAGGGRYLGTTVQDNMNVNGWNTLNCTYPQCVEKSSAWAYFADGKTVIESELSATNAIKISHVPTYSIPDSYIMEKFASGKAVARSGTDNTYTFTATSDELSWIYTGGVVGFYRADKFWGYGIITNISGSDVTTGYIPSTVTNDTYDLKIYRKLQFFTFLGDISAGSDQITNVRVDVGSATQFVSDNTLFLQNVTAASDNSRSSFVLTNWDNGTKTFTANKVFNVTKTGVYFSNNGYVKNISTFGSTFNVFTSIYAKSYLLQKGGRITTMVDGEPITYLVTKSGYLDAASQSDSRQAEWVLDNCCPTTTSTTTAAP